MWGLLISNFEKKNLRIVKEEILCLLQYSSIKRVKSIVADAKVTIAFFHTFAYCHYQGLQKCENYLGMSKM